MSMVVIWEYCGLPWKIGCLKMLLWDQVISNTEGSQEKRGNEERRVVLTAIKLAVKCVTRLSGNTVGSLAIRTCFTWSYIEIWKTKDAHSRSRQT